MSPELYAIIGVGVGLSSLSIGTAGLMLFLINQTNRRMDRIEAQFTQRMDRLEDKIDRLLEDIHSLDLRVSKLEWMLDAALHGKPVTFPSPPEPAAD